MKKSILGALGLAAGGLVIYAGSVVWAQQPPRPPSTPAPVTSSPAVGKSRVAIVNLQEVLKNYPKFTAFRDQLKAKAEQYDQTLNNKIKRVQGLEKEYKDPKTTQQKKEQIEKEVKQLKFDMDELKAQARKDVMKFQDEQVTQMYREVEAVVKEYATANGIELVFRFNEDWGQDYHNPDQTVARMSMPFWPMHHDKGADITQAIASLLNRKYAMPTPTPGTNVVQPASNKVPKQ